MADYPISKIQYGSDGYPLRDAKAEAVLPELVDDGAKNIADMSKTNTVFPDTSTGATITKDGDLFTINGTTNATGTLIVNIYFDTATTKIIPNGDYVAQLFPYSNNIKVQAVGTSIISGENAQPLEFSITSSDTRSWIRIELDHSTTFTNHQFRLMLCKKSEWNISQEFNQYAVSNSVLTQAAINLIDNGAKNKLYFTSTKVGQNAGCIYTVNDDGSITVDVSGKTGNSYHTLSIGSVDQTIDEFCDGTFVLSGCPPGGGASNAYRMYAAKSTYSAYDYGSGVILPSRGSVTGINVVIYVDAGYSGDNITFKPMICKKADWDVTQEFNPYSLPNPPLTTAAIKAVDEGAKNIYKLYYRPVNANNLQYTINSDDTITVTGGYGILSCAFSYGGAPIPSSQGLVFSGCPTGGSENKYYSYVYVNENDRYVELGDAILKDVETGIQYQTMPVAGTITWTLHVVQGNTTYPLTFKPMVCTNNDWLISRKYVPYAMTNLELTKHSPRIIVKSKTGITASTSLTDTGVSYTIPARKMVRITATAFFSADSPVEVALGTGNSMFAHEVAVTGDVVYSLTASAYIGGFSSDQIVKVFARYKTESSNIIYLLVEEIPDQ